MGLEKSCKEQANEILLDLMKELAEKMNVDNTWPTAGPIARDYATAMATLANAISDT